MSITSSWINIPSGKDSFQGYLALPKGGTGPAVIIIQEIFGVNSHIRDVADQYARAGYVAIAPDIFWRAQPRVELGYTGPDHEKGVELMQKTDVELAVADISATASALRAMPEVTGKIATIGFCFGGRLSYLAAAQGSVDAAVCYYGGGIQTQLEEASKIKMPNVFHYAELDAYIPLSAVGEGKERFAGRSNAMFYTDLDADPGFNCPHRQSSHQRAAALAHCRTLTFLGENL